MEEREEGIVRHFADGADGIGEEREKQRSEKGKNRLAAQNGGEVG